MNLPALKVFVPANMLDDNLLIACEGYAGSVNPVLHPLTGDRVSYLHLVGQLPVALPAELSDIAVGFNYSCPVKESGHQVGDRLDDGRTRIFHTGHYLEITTTTFDTLAGLVPAFLRGVDTWHDNQVRTARENRAAAEQLAAALNGARPVLDQHAQALRETRFR